MEIELHLRQIGWRERFLMELARLVGAPVVLNYGPPSIVAGGIPLRY